MLITCISGHDCSCWDLVHLSLQLHTGNTSNLYFVMSVQLSKEKRLTVLNL